jgi:hypothetical protein
MIYINILTHLREKLFIKQLSQEFELNGIVFKINSTEDIEWDAIVVYEDIDYSWTCKYQSGRLFFISGEPPIVKVYSSKFIEQFDCVISAHTNIKHSNAYLSQQSLPWYLGYEFNTDQIHYDFHELESLPTPSKSKKISFITSNREFLPGHIARLAFLEELQKHYSNEIDFFGKGLNFLNDKSEGLVPYQFSICIENSIIENYWTEKIAVVFLSYTIPVYYGCKNINSYFSSDSYIPIEINKKKDALNTIDRIIENADSIYKKMFPYMIESRKRLLYEYNIYPMILRLINSQPKRFDNKIIKKVINPSTIYTDNKFANQYLKIKRRLTKLKGYI